jgi:hypothetical protein
MVPTTHAKGAQMTTDRAGPEGTIGRGERDETPCLYWLGPDGLYVINLLDNLTTPEIHALTLNAWPGEPAKPVGSVSRPPESPG